MRLCSGRVNCNQQKMFRYVDSRRAAVPSWGMKKSEAIKLAGSGSALAALLGLTRAAVSKWRVIPPLRLYQLQEIRPEWFRPRQKRHKMGAR